MRMRKTYRLTNLCCANCAAKIERGIQKIDGIQEASVSFMAQRLVIEYENVDLADITEKIKTVIVKVEPDCMLIG